MEEYWEEDDWDEEEYMEEWECDDLPCECYGYCDPSCPYWLGDGLCELAIEAQAEADRQYREKYLHKNVKCRVCGKTLDMYDIPDAKDPFIVPADLAMIGLEIYGPIWAEKKILHEYRDGEGYRVLHITFPGWKEKKDVLVRLLGAKEYQKEA